jgi:MFS family permease
MAEIVEDSVVAALLPFTLAVFLGFLAIGLPLPVLPLLVHDGFGFGTVTVGLVIGAQSVTTLLTRQYAGRLCDRRGTKPTALLGFCSAALAGVFYLASSLVTAPDVALTVLAAGRVVLGFGESLFITALAAWSVARVGPAHAGRALAWQGIAMYGAMTFGAAVGGWVEQGFGFATVAVLVVVCPLVAGGMTLGIPSIAVVAGPRKSFSSVVRAIWMQGAALALASAGFGTIAAFLALRYRAAGWSDPGIALAAFGCAYIGVRVVFGGLPDRIGGRQVAVLCLLIQVVGQLLIFGAWTSMMAFAGVFLAGLGYSLVFPALGVEAMKRVAAQDRSLFIGAFLACFDLGIGAAGPVAGAVGANFGIPAAFFAAAAMAALSIVLVVAGAGKPPQQTPG